MSKENTPVPKTSLLDFINTSEETQTDSVESADTSTDNNGVGDAALHEQEKGEEGNEAKAEGQVASEFFVGEGDVKVPHTAKFKIGDADVPAKDIFNAYTTREEISRRFNEIGKREQRLNTDKEHIKKEREELALINEKFAEMAQLVREGNPLGALQIALAMSGDADKNTLEGLVNKSIEIAENFQSMSDDERKVFLEKEGVAFRERKVKRDQEKIDAQNRTVEARNYYDRIVQHFGLTEDELSAAVDVVIQDPNRRESLNDPDYMKRIDTTVSQALGRRFQTTIEEGISKAAPDMVQDQKLRLALIELVDTRYTSDDIADVVASYLGRDNRKNSANGTTAASTKDVTAKTVTTPNRAPTSKPQAEKKESEPASYAGDFEALIRKHSQ